jgi:hypothetical protein
MHKSKGLSRENKRRRERIYIMPFLFISLSNSFWWWLTVIDITPHSAHSCTHAFYTHTHTHSQSGDVCCEAYNVRSRSIERKVKFSGNFSLLGQLLKFVNKSYFFTARLGEEKKSFGGPKKSTKNIKTV